jgi:hypothetical protein
MWVLHEPWKGSSVFSPGLHPRVCSQIHPIGFVRMLVNRIRDHTEYQGVSARRLGDITHRICMAIAWCGV